jgi:hypothetical protein
MLIIVDVIEFPVESGGDVILLQIKIIVRCKMCVLLRYLFC